MIADIWTIMRKEWREIFLQRGSWRSGWVGLLFTVGVFGIFLPLQTGRAWVESPALLVVWLWVPLFLVMTVVTDSFAGERERHTLETLLASRLSDRAILLGKLAASVGYGWGLTLFMLLLGLLTVNVAYARGELLIYPPAIGLGIVVLTLLAAGLIGGVGVLISLRAATVRQAAQTLSVAIMLLLFVPLFGVQALPHEWQLALAQAVTELDVPRLMLVVAAVLAVLNVGLLAAAMARFQRARLILD